MLFTFAFLSLILVSLGASVYERNVSDMQEVAAKRTAFAYVTQKVRQADEAGRVRVGVFPVEVHSSYYGEALIFSREIRGEIYETYLYAYDGSLRELTVRAGGDITPGMGAAILPAELFRVKADETRNGLLHIELHTITDNRPKVQELKLYVRSMEADP